MPSNIVTQRVGPKTFLVCNSLRAWLYVLSCPRSYESTFRTRDPERGKGTQALAFASPAGTVTGTCPNDWYPYFKLQVSVDVESFVCSRTQRTLVQDHLTFQGNAYEHGLHPFGFHLVIAGDSGSASRPTSIARAWECPLETVITAWGDPSSTAALQNDNASLFQIDNTYTNRQSSSRQDAIYTYIYPPSLP